MRHPFPAGYYAQNVEPMMREGVKSLVDNFTICNGTNRLMARPLRIQYPGAKGDRRSLWDQELWHGGLGMSRSRL